MAEQIISPGVFTRENDLSFLPAGVGAIGAAIVGPTVKGPAFVPTVVNSFADYERKFGPLNSDTFVPQTVREYLKNELFSLEEKETIIAKTFTDKYGKGSLDIETGEFTPVE